MVGLVSIQSSLVVDASNVVVVCARCIKSPIGKSTYHSPIKANLASANHQSTILHCAKSSGTAHEANSRTGKSTSNKARHAPFAGTNAVSDVSCCTGKSTNCSTNWACSPWNQL